MTLSEQAARLWQRQEQAWDFLARQAAAVAQQERRTIRVEGRSYTLCHNPGRLTSAAAAVKDGRVERPCFLCEGARPAEQEAVELTAPATGHRYELLANPYPILAPHFTIVAAEHVPQSLADGRLDDMEWLARAMPGYLIFYNGARCGASAPDHMHLQAVPAAEVPMVGAWSEAERAELGVVGERPSIPIHTDESDSPFAACDDTTVNVACWTDDATGGVLWRTVRRRRHRPEQYAAAGTAQGATAGEGQVLMSPAALEYCGVVPLARREDYERMTPALLADILGQCERREPLVHVGIVDTPETIEVHLLAADGTTRRRLMVDRDEAPAGEGTEGILAYDMDRSTPERLRDLRWAGGRFTLPAVIIGKEFHWQQREAQTFGGSLHVFAAEGEVHAVNLVPVEDYLRSVISSEMAATNNLQLLMAHAILSRSWLLRQMEAKAAEETPYIYKVRARDEALMADVAERDRIIRWWDHEDHRLYDVCADDHCQRYQGLGRQTSPLVDEAVRRTRGMVLLDREGGICDARFSKCCGGRSERFDVCWQDDDPHYLQPVDDPWCDPHDADVLRLVLNDYDRTTTDFHDWSVRLTQRELSDLIERKLQLGLGRVMELIPLKRGASGRIEFLKVVGTARTVVIGKELTIRKALSPSHLYSSAFDVATSTTPEGETLFTLTGRGWGHGVGLCQIGAACMSVAGKTYDEILHHYFTGVRIERLY